MKAKREILTSGTVLLALACAGCGQDGPEISYVEGSIKMDGKPLAGASVTFFPENGRPAGAWTDEDGHYVLNFNLDRKGAIPGKNRVRIGTLRDGGQDPEGKRIPGSPETVPPKYNSQTTLVFVVEQGKKNVANFELVSGGYKPSQGVEE